MMRGSAPHILTVIDNVHMGLGHDGLSLIAQKHAKIDPDKLKQGELLMFLNRAKDKLKVYGPNQVIAYYRSPKGRRIMLEAIQYIPQAFAKDGRIDYDGALRKVFETKLGHLVEAGARRKTMSPLEVHRALNA